MVKRLSEELSSYFLRIQSSTCDFSHLLFPPPNTEKGFGKSGDSIIFLIADENGL